MKQVAAAGPKAVFAGNKTRRRRSGGRNGASALLPICLFPPWSSIFVNLSQTLKKAHLMAHNTETDMNGRHFGVWSPVLRVQPCSEPLMSLFTPTKTPSVYVQVTAPSSSRSSYGGRKTRKSGDVVMQHQSRVEVGWTGGSQNIRL